MLSANRIAFALLGAVLAWCMLSCNVSEEEGRAYLDVAVDSTWSKYDTISIAWVDTVTGEKGEFYRGPPEELRKKNRVPANGYHGQKVVITIQGIKDKVVVFEEVRRYDASQPDAVVKLIIKPYDPGAKPDTTKPVVPDTTKPVKPDTTKPVVPDTTKPVVPDTTKPVVPDTLKPGPDSLGQPRSARPTLAPDPAPDSVSIGDSVMFTAKATVDSGALAKFAFDFQGDGISDDSGSLSGKSAIVSGGYRFKALGVYPIGLRVVSAADSSAKATWTLRVVKDEPLANAGMDTTVYLGTQVRLHGSAKDGSGRIVKTEWKIGGAEFIAIIPEHSFQAPDAPGDVVCLFRATDDDGFASVDTMLVHVVSKSESNLTGISVSKGELSPQFNPAVLVYEDTVPFTVVSASLIASGEGAIAINGTLAVSGEPSSIIELPVGRTEVVVSVRREGSQEKSYKITLVRQAPSGNADLSTLVISAGALDSAFSPRDTAYLSSVGNGITSTTLTATITGPYTSLKLNGVEFASGVASAPVSLAVGENRLTVEITAQSGVKKTYSIHVVRAPNVNSNLIGLTSSLGAFSSAFFPATYEYSMDVGYADSSTSIGATAAAATSSLMINGQSASSGVGVKVGLAIGNNRIPVIVTSQGGSKSTYVLIITRAQDARNELTGLSLSVGTLNPAFSPSVSSYRASVGNEILSLIVRPVNTAETSIDSVNGVPVAGGSNSPAINLLVGDNTIRVKVTAQNGAQRTYTVVVTRGQSGNAVLATLTVGEGSLTPDFDKDSLAYTVLLGNSVTSLPVSATVSDSTASYTVTPVSPVELKVGDNTITVEVTAQNQSKRAYVIKAVRAKNGNARLSGMVCSGGELIPAFKPDVLNYSLTVVNTVLVATIRPTVAETTSTVLVNNQPTKSGFNSTPISLNEGSNPIPVAVTAQDGTVRNYKVTILRELPANADLKALSATSRTSGGSSGEMYLNAPFQAATLAYQTAPGQGGMNARVRATVALDPATLQINGKAVASGQESQDIPLLANGPTPITIVVTAPDGHTQKTYTLSVAKPSDVGFAPSYTNLSKTWDGGQTWTVMNPTPSFNLQAVHFFDANVGIASGYPGEIFKTTDGGTTWAKKGSFIHDFNQNNIDMLQFLDSKIGFAFGYTCVAKTTDGGETWKSIYEFGGGIHSAYAFDENNIIMGVIGGSFIRTSDGGKNWEWQNGPNMGTVFGMDFLRADYGIMSMSWTTAIRTRDRGATYDTIALFPEEVYMSAAKALDENTFLLGGEDGILLKTKDGGKTWVEKLHLSSFNYVQQIYFRDARNGFVCVTNSNLMYRTSDAGETWTEYAMPKGSGAGSVFFLK